MSRWISSQATSSSSTTLRSSTRARRTPTTTTPTVADTCSVYGWPPTSSSASRTSYGRAYPDANSPRPPRHACERAKRGVGPLEDPLPVHEAWAAQPITSAWSADEVDDWRTGRDAAEPVELRTCPLDARTADVI